MARIRSLKPEFFTSEQIVSVSIPARMLFQGMWVFGDDDGYIAASPVQLKMKVFPADDVNVTALLDELEEAALIERLHVDQGEVLRVPSFLNHQSPKYPTPTKYTLDGASLTQHSPSTGGKVGKRSGSIHPGEERRGEEREKKRPANRVTDSDFEKAYSHWPKKTERAKSFEKFKKVAAERGLDVITADVIRFGDAYARSTEKQFVPALVVWLNGKRWTDELPGAEKPKHDGYYVERPPAPEGKRYAVDVANGVNW